ncbi:MAG: hypothetical protein K0B02_03145 [DPANN group archaeon]|nr:hypothetical protein [DPANN group archaeon]
MANTDDIITIDMNNINYRGILKKRESEGWVFSEKVGKTIYLKKADDPLVSVNDSLMLIGLFMFVILFILIILLLF